MASCLGHIQSVSVSLGSLSCWGFTWFSDNFPHLLYFMVIFADFNNILPSKIFCMQGKVPNGEIHPSFTLPELPQDRSMYGGDEGGLVIKTHLRNLEIVCTDLLGPLRKMWSENYDWWQGSETVKVRIHDKSCDWRCTQLWELLKTAELKLGLWKWDTGSRLLSGRRISNSKGFVCLTPSLKTAMKQIRGGYYKGSIIFYL